jgi:septal ring factor EnvC (AmiA/AmiB activator)
MDYNSIELTPEELAAAILEGKKRKFFRLRNADYLKEQLAKADQAHEDEKKAKRDAYRQAREASSGSEAQTLSVEYRSTPEGLRQI